MTDCYELVAEFQQTFETPDDPGFWIDLIAEETAEVREAYAHFLKEVADLRYVLSGFINTLDTNFLRGAADLQRLETLNEAGETLEKVPSIEQSAVFSRVFRAVHESNMSKVGEDGKPIRDPETGKILKGPNYQAPDIESLIFS